MNLFKRLVPVVFAVLAAAGPARALDIDVTRFTLDNGMQVVVIPDHRAPVVTHMVWYKVGAADEPKGKAGIAHLLEHLMFKGTPEHPGRCFSASCAPMAARTTPSPPRITPPISSGS